MDIRALDSRRHNSGPTQSDESALDLERKFCSFPNLRSSSPPLQAYASGGQHSESNAAYFSWPTSTQLHGAAEGRANYFGNLQKEVLVENLESLPTGQQATTLLELMTIRAFHSKILRRYSLGTAIGFRIRQGILTDIPAILVFVARKVHRQWLSHIQCLPSQLEVRNRKHYMCFVLLLFGILSLSSFFYFVFEISYAMFCFFLTDVLLLKFNSLSIPLIGTRKCVV